MTPTMLSGDDDALPIHLVNNTTSVVKETAVDRVDRVAPCQPETTSITAVDPHPSPLCQIPLSADSMRVLAA
jgi:hypothetical protein